MRVLILCRFSDLPWFGWHHGAALERLGAQLSYVPEDAPLDASAEELMAACPEKPAFLLKPDWHLFPIPGGIEKARVPTVLFQEDVYRYTERRVRWSMLFDHVMIFHPGYEEAFRRAGHPNPVVFPYAAVWELFQKPEGERVFEVGWVGRTQGELYARRRRLLPGLATQFQMNDWQRNYSQAEMADVFLGSKIVLNIPRDDHPAEANMRVYEVMGSGALLCTPWPTELTSLGFQEGEHFIAFRRDEELVPLLRRYLENDPERRRIAAAARERVLREDIYECRARTLLDHVARHPLHAPAREWPGHRVRLAYADYYAGARFLGLAWKQLPSIARGSLLDSLRATRLIGRALGSRLLARFG